MKSSLNSAIKQSLAPGGQRSDSNPLIIHRIVSSVIYQLPYMYQFAGGLLSVANNVRK